MYKLIMGIGTALVLGLIGLGCGGSGEEATSAPLSKAQFIKQADEICTRFGKQRQIAANKFISELSGGAAEVEAHLSEALKQVVAPSLRKEAVELESLQPPGSEEAEVAQILERLSQAGSFLAKKGAQGLHHSPLPVFEREATAYGFAVCSNPY